MIKAQSTVIVQRIPTTKGIPFGFCVQAADEIQENAQQKEAKKSIEDEILIRYNVLPGHRLYPFLKNSRFFIIKSANEENIRISQKNEEWATTTFNQDKLDKAYQLCENVIFFFSVNKTGFFQGMAKMVSGLTSKVSREWVTEGKILGNKKI